MDNRKVILIVLIVALAGVIWYYISNQTPANPTLAAPLPTSPTPADPSAPAPVSQQDTPVITPGVITGTGATFTAGQSDASLQGGGTSSDPLLGLPSGFVTWVNSLGPINRPLLIAQLPNISQSDMNLVDQIVSQNLWGNASVAGAWNTFTAKLKSIGIPQRGTQFSSFNKR